MTKYKANWNNAVTTNDKGENTMQQVDTILLVPKVSAIFNKVVHFFGHSRLPSTQSNPVTINIDWPDSDFEQSYCGRDNQPVSGGYNEAYIVQYWTSYHLR